MWDPTGVERPDGLEQQLARLGPPPGARGAALEAMRSVLHQRLGAERSGLLARWRGATAGLRWAVVVGGLGAMLAGSALVMPRGDLVSYPVVRLWASIAGFFTAAAGGAWLVLRPLHRPPLRRPLMLTFVGVAIALPVLLALLPNASTGLLLAPADFAAPVLRSASACLVLGLVLGVPLIASVGLLDRGGLYASGRALLAVVVAVAATNAALLLHCPHDEPGHLLLGHAGLFVPFLLLWAALRFWKRDSTEKK